jgi:hypothetical protein
MNVIYEAECGAPKEKFRSIQQGNHSLGRNAASKLYGMKISLDFFCYFSLSRKKSNRYVITVH